MKRLVIVKRPEEKYGAFKYIPDSLESLQRQVGGFIEAVTVRPDIVILCDEEGRLKGYQDNCTICGVSFVGTILAIGVNGEEFDDLDITWREWKELVDDETN